MQHYLSVFCKAIRNLESQSVDSTNIYDIMSNLRDQISSRYEKEFFGFIVKQALPNLTTYEQKKFKQEALAVYKRALDYLREWFDFDNSVFKKFNLFKLEDSVPSLDEVLDLCTEFGIQVNIFQYKQISYSNFEEVI